MRVSRDTDLIESVGLDIVDRLLGIPSDYPMWRAADMANRAGILATWLSGAIARDLPVTDAARAYLDRTRRRVADLHRIGEEMAAAHGVRVIKGPRIAQHLPAPLLRQSGDVDLVAADEASLWACVVDLRARFDAVPQGVSVLDGPDGVHIGVFLKWPAAEPQLDKPMGADITTCAFSGDLRGVPVRAAAPDDDDLCGLFAIAEERFQHKYRTKDLLDLLVLAEVLERRFGDDLVEIVCRTAADLALAPELRGLIGRLSGWVPMTDRWQEIHAALTSLARAEKSLRQPDRKGIYRLRYGFPLDARPSDAPVATFLRRGACELATTPVGTCLLVRDRILDEDLLVDALAHARALHGIEERG